ncbi:hypothetical protein BgiMline_021743 [Biomphalaria glabrata]
MGNTKQPKHFIGSGENWISPGATSPIALALRIFERGEGGGEAGQPVTLTPCAARQWRSLPHFRSLGELRQHRRTYVVRHDIDIDRGGREFGRGWVS